MCFVLACSGLLCAALSTRPSTPPAPDSLPDRSLLLASIDSFYARRSHALLLELEESRQGDWLRYLPALGITYTAQGAPRPTLSFSSSLLHTYRKERQQRNARRQAILAQALLDADADKRKLLQLLQACSHTSLDLQTKREVHALDSALFAFHTQQSQSLALLPSEFLAKKREFLLKSLDLQQLEAKRSALLAEVLSLARWPPR